MRLRTLRICLILVFALLNINKVTHAQCPGGKPFETLNNTYTTNLGSLTDSLYYPHKFDPSLGTLMGVELTISTLGNAILEVVNDVGEPIVYEITYRRRDRITGPGLGSGILLDTSVVFPDINIGPSANPAVATSTPPWKSNGINCLDEDGDVIDGCPDPYGNAWGTIQAAPAVANSSPATPSSFTSILSPADFGAFIGSGSVKFKYDVLASLLAEGFGGRYSQRIVTLNTQVTISTVYTYCVMGVLPIGELTFLARKANNSNVELSWTKESEENNIVYTPEVSANGFDFNSVGTMQSQKPASAGTIVKYEFGYTVPASVSGNLYFRLKQTNALGKIQYSAISAVDIDNSNHLTLSVFPNPAEKNITLQFNTVQKHNLQFELINSVGQIVETSRIAANGSYTHSLTFMKKHQSGIYFMRVTDLANKSHNVSRLVIR